MSHWKVIILGHIETLQGSSTGGGTLESLAAETTNRADWIDAHPESAAEPQATAAKRELWERWGDGVADDLAAQVSAVQSRLDAD